MIIFKQAAKRILRNKVRFIILMVIPMMFILMFAIQSDISFSIGVVDKDGSYLSGKMIDTLKAMYKTKIEVLDEKDVYDKIISYQEDYCIIIEQGFEQRLLKGEKPDLEEFYVSDNSTSPKSAASKLRLVLL